MATTEPAVQYGTGSDDAKNLGNLVRYESAAGTYYWFAYRHNNGLYKDLYTARSKDLRTWENFKMPSVSGLKIDPHTDNRPILVVSGGKLYLFWMDSDKDRLLAAVYGPESANPAKNSWSRYVDCKNTLGENIKERGDNADAAMGAVASGNAILVAMNHGSSIKYFVFDPDTKGNDKWYASAESKVVPADFDVTPAIKSFGKNHAVALSSLSPDETYAIDAVRATDAAGKERTLVLQLRLATAAAWWGPVLKPGEEGASLQAAWWVDQDHPTRGAATRMTLANDPGGRVVASFARSDAPLCRVLAAGKGPDAWGPEESLADYGVVSYPSVFYDLGAAETTRTATHKEAHQRKVTRWALLHKISTKTTYVRGTDSGLARKVMRAEELNLTTASTSRTLIVQGYIDGPPPVFDGMGNPMSEVNYALTSATTASHEVETNVSYGVKTEGNASPVVGAGPMWEASFSLGVGAAWGGEVSKSITQNTRFQLQIGADRRYLQKGLARCSELVLCRDAYEYLPDGVNPVQDGPIFTSVYVLYQHDNKLEYTLGTVTVGDLESYTADAWNERMAPLYDGPEYEGKTYLDIIRPYAVRFNNNTLSALSDMWTPGSPIDHAFASTSQQYESSSMKLEASVFTGVSAEFFGMEASFMSGWTTSVATTSKSTEASGFGLEVVVDGTAGGDVARYRVSTMLLESSNHWVRELIHFQRDQSRGYTIDPNASCWKVMYVVDAIEYDDLLDVLDLRPALRAELDAKGLRKTQDVLRSLGLAFPSDLHARTAADENPAHHEVLAALRAWDAGRNVYPKPATPEVEAPSADEPELENA